MWRLTGEQYRFTLAASGVRAPTPSSLAVTVLSMRGASAALREVLPAPSILAHRGAYVEAFPYHPERARRLLVT